MKPLFLLIILSIFTASCGHREADTAVPRRTAYARVAEYPDSTRSIGVGGLEMQVNAGASLSSPMQGWCDISYPLYGAAIHLTARHFADRKDLDEAVANREERIGLNLGENAAEQTEFTNAAGFSCLVVRTLAADPVPVQFLAVGPGGDMLSGSVAFTGRTEPYDSVAPMVEALYAHTITLLHSLETK